MLRGELNRGYSQELPHLAALVCHSLIDLAIYDAYGNLHSLPVFETLTADFLPVDLGHFWSRRRSLPGNGRRIF